jgi:puromycin-sensitive aminopeptidase
MRDSYAMSDDATTPTDHRLPTTVTPSRYDLTLAPDLDAATFAGTADIDVEVHEPTATVVLNAADLTVDDAWVDQGGRRVAVEAELDATTERLTLVAPDELAPGPAVVHIGFEGVLNDQLKGFYRSTFTDDHGEEQVLATTQFEATDARRAFPCWDEPEHKASFAITLEVDEGLLAVSNAREIDRTRTGSRVRVRFADTMVMSTYLVAFVVGPLEVTEAVTTSGGTELQVVHPPGKADLTGFALEVGAFALDFFADYYDIAYPGDKLDLVAIPDFAFGAMENLGCVTFREVLLLVDPETATQPELQNVVDVISHELAHMWFGDLVTMRWWNGIWLNEAFATFMEMLATDAFRPAWERWVTFGVSRTAALDVDALHATRPIEYPVSSPADAEGMFDILTYEKGAATVRMLERHLGEAAFRQGISAYLAEHAHDNTETGDLWDALEAASGEPARRIMDSWIFQGGYPVVEVSIDGDDAALRQERFTYLPDAEAATWSVPVHVRHESGGAARADRALLDGAGSDDRLLRLPLVGDPDWLIANGEGDGFFRVAYAPELLRRNVAHAQDALHPIERYALVDDAWAFVLADRMTAPDWLALAEGFGAERDLTVWQRLLGGVSTLDRLVEGVARDTLRARALALTASVADELGPQPAPTDDDRRRQLRAAVFAARGAAGDEAVLERAAALHAGHVSDPGTVAPELVAAAVTVLAERGRPADHADFINRFETADTPQEQMRYLHALADFEDETLFAATLELVASERVRTQNAPYVLRRALTNRERGADAWAFVSSRWDQLTERFPSNSIARMLEGIRALDRADLAEEVLRFVERHPVPQGEKIVDQHRERLLVNVALRSREAERLDAHLR